jgi:hypothetical protein
MTNTPPLQADDGKSVREILVTFSKKLAVVQGEYNANLKPSVVQAHAEDAVDEAVSELNQLIAARVEAARIEENEACQQIIRSKWGTNDQLWEMQYRIKEQLEQRANLRQKPQASQEGMEG